MVTIFQRVFNLLTGMGRHDDEKGDENMDV